MATPYPPPYQQHPQLHSYQHPPHLHQAYGNGDGNDNGGLTPTYKPATTSTCTWLMRFIYLLAYILQLVVVWNAVQYFARPGIHVFVFVLWQAFFVYVLVQIASVMDRDRRWSVA